MNSNNKIAIDVALLLPDDMAKWVCDLSAKIISPENTKPYVLDNENYFPHITLLQGTAKESDIEQIKKKVELIYKKYLPLKITFTEIKTDKRYPYLVIKKTDEIVNFQNEIAEFIQLDYDATREMFADPEITDRIIEYVNKFKENNLGGKYNIHTTLGMGDTSLLKANFPVEVLVNTIAICHLGYSCSCRKVLAKIVVQNRI